MGIKTDDIIIKIVRFEDGDLKAMFSLNFGDIVVRGFRIRKSKFKSDTGADELWIVPPSYQSKGKYHPIFYVPDADLWKKIQNKILKEYHKLENEVRDEDLI